MFTEKCVNLQIFSLESEYLLVAEGTLIILTNWFRSEIETEDFATDADAG